MEQLVLHSNAETHLTVQRELLILDSNAWNHLCSNELTILNRIIKAK